MVFVVLNGIVFLYRTVMRRQQAAAAMMPSSPAPTVNVPMPAPYSPPPPVATEPATHVIPSISSSAQEISSVPENSQSTHSRVIESTEGVRRSEPPSATPARPAPRKSGPRRAPPIATRPPITAAPADEPAGKGLPARSPDNPPDKAQEREDILKKMEANPYKRGE
jgi:hypothetical protein